jgi:predicted tellurium resistance membrane protein TerC
MPAADWILPLVTLTAMEIILGIDNVIFIAILVSRLPVGQQEWTRRVGLMVALGTRLLLLFTITFIMGLGGTSVFHLTDLGIPPSWMQDPEVNSITWRDLILIAGGLFLIGKSTYEIHDKLEGAPAKPAVKIAGRLGWILAQIAVLDIVFSLDSVITAVGMAQQLWIMVAAMIVAVGVMLVFAGPIGNFVHRHPTIKMLALSFLLLIGVMLVAEGIEKHIERGYIYFAMAFSLFVEMLNLRLRTPAPPVELHGAPVP